jgi:hypothetical protein
VLTVSLTAHAGQHGGFARLGDMDVSFTEGSGLGLRYCDQSLITESSVTFHDGAWQRSYYSLPRQVADVVVKSTPQIATLQIVGSPDSDALAADYTITGKSDHTARLDLNFEPKTNSPMALEYCALQMNTGPLAGCPFKATAGKVVTTGTIPHADNGTNELLANRVSEFSVESRLGTILFRTDGGEPWLDVLDGRKRSWADPHDPVLWIGMLNHEHPSHMRAAHWSVTGKDIGFQRRMIELLQGKNIADPTYPLFLSAARAAWKGKMPNGTPVKVYAYAWKNPRVEREISSIDFVSAGTRASPTLIGLSVITP